MRSSRSTNVQPDCSPKARPTLLLPAPIKPTRKSARTGGAAECESFFFGRRTPDRFCMRTGLLGRPFARIGFRVVVYFSERFLRWILPLKVRSTTEDAALLMVPEKALPTLVGNQL